MQIECIMGTRCYTELVSRRGVRLAQVKARALYQEFQGVLAQNWKSKRQRRRERQEGCITEAE